MKTAKTVIMAMIVAFAMIGTLGFAAATYTSVELENKNSTWQPIADGISATINYDSSGDEFVWSASGTASASTTYSLIYYADPWPGNNPGAFIGTIDTDASGVMTGSGSINLDMDLPHADDANVAPVPDYCDYNNGFDDYDHCCGAKLWMVLSADYDAANETMIAWTPANYLFETDLITYTDCDLYDTSPPAAATFTIGDAFGVTTIPITITNATNVGTVDMILSYNASLVTVTSVTNGDMDTIYSNIGTGQVQILTYQGTSSGLSGDFTLANVSFTTVGTGTDAFTIYVTTYTDATPCQREMPFDITEGQGTTYLNGDVNGDGKVDASDVMYLAKHVLLITGFEDIIELASDVNGKDGVTMDDVTYLAMHIVGASSWEVLL